MEKSQKTRLDIALTNLGLAPSRERAKALIMSGKVLVNGQREDKPGQSFDLSKSTIVLKGDDLPFVSRGGLKLDKALNVFAIDLRDCICMDIGASTGGFTDCMLKSGARGVVAIDVGFGQLDWGLRNDSRVTVYEKTNFRYFDEDSYKDEIDFISMDVSFISITKLLLQSLLYLKADGRIVCLIKPQFEAGREFVGKKGVVRDIKVHEKVMKDCLEFAIGAGLEIIGLDFSPIRGPEGNIEYLAYMRRTGESVSYKDYDLTENEKETVNRIINIDNIDSVINKTAEAAHRFFKESN